MTSELRTLWRDGGWAARAATVVGGGSVVAHAASLCGVRWGDLAAVGVVLHLGVMALIVGLWLSGARRLFARGRARGPAAPLPRRLVLLSVALALYALAWFFGTFAAYGEGWYEERSGRYLWLRGGEVVRELTAAQARWADARMLSVFSACWLAFALPLAIAYYRRATRHRVRSGGDVAAA